MLAFTCDMKYWLVSDLGTTFANMTYYCRNLYAYMVVCRCCHLALAALDTLFASPLIQVSYHHSWWICPSTLHCALGHLPCQPYYVEVMATQITSGFLPFDSWLWDFTALVEFGSPSNCSLSITVRQAVSIFINIDHHWFYIAVNIGEELQ